MLYLKTYLSLHFSWIRIKYECSSTNLLKRCRPGILQAFPISLRVLGPIANARCISSELGLAIVCRKHSSRRLYASLKDSSRWSGSPLLGRSKRLSRRINCVEIINNATRQRVSNFHLHVGQSKHNARWVSERHRMAWRAGHKGAAGH